MRLASLLPMLLLLVSPLTAQQNCEIFDLTASVVQFNQNTCQFFVELNFQHLGTTNQYNVHGNGHNYGTFPYNQVPTILGPFTANPVDPTNLEFVVQDAVFQDCFDNVNLTIPPCVSVGNCEISNLSVDVGDCHPLLGTYNITIDFQLSNSINAFFQVFTAAGVSLGEFPVSSLPLTINNFPWGGGAFDVLKVCISNQVDCCKTIEFQAPNCFNGSCGIVDLSVDTGDCTSDSTYKAKVKFGLLNIIPGIDSFQLSANGQFIGTFGINQLPLPFEITTNGGANDVVKVCVQTPTGQPCCLEKEFPVPACLSPCAIHDLKVETDTCSSDSTFGIWVNFNVSDSTAVDSFELWGNTHSLGHFGIDQLPLYIPNFEWNGLIFNSIKVCTGNSPACCKELQFLAPDCLPFDTLCEITHVFALAGPCTSDSTYKLTVNFNANNPGNGTFIVYANGVLLDTFNLNQAPLMIPNFPWNGGANDVVTICIGGQTVPGAIGCCKSKEFAVPPCILPCEISDLHVEVGDCNPNGGYKVTVNFTAHNPGNDLFDLYANGQLLGTFPLNQLPLTIPNFPGSGNQIDVIKVCINDHPDCCKAIEFQAPNCNCEIYDLHVETGDCNPAGGYVVKVNFGVHNPGNDFFDLYANGQLLGTFPLNQLPLTIPNFPGSGNQIDVIKVCINDHPDCCKAIEFQAPNCNNPCEIYDLNVQVGDCNPLGGYALTVNFGVHNPGNDFFDLYANGQLLGTFPLNQLPLTIPNFPGSGNQIDVIKVCINDHPDCCKAIEFQAPNCNNDCSIFDLHVQVGDCNLQGGYALTVNFGVHNPPSDSFDIYANGQFLGTYVLNQLPLHLPNFPGSGNAIDVLKVCIHGQPDCCKAIEFQAPNCNGVCEIYDLVVQVGDCNPAGGYAVTVNFGVHNPGNDFFNLFANGQLLGTYPLNQLPLTIPNFPGSGNAFDHIKVCINDHPDCCKGLEFQAPNCNGQDCEITNLHVETGNCTSDSTYQLAFNFNVANPPGNVFGVWANGQFLGLYGLGQLPIAIPNFPWNGGPNDVLKVCFGNSTGGAVTCCATVEFPVPDCLTQGGDCEIFNMTVQTGDCTGDSTYNLKLNFQVQNPPNNVFTVFGNGGIIGVFNLNQLPLQIQNFQWNGGQNDVIKVCFINPNGLELCCRTIEFPVPDCLGQGGNCEIFGMVVDPGDCNSDSTYSLFLNFQVQNPPGNMFGVWGNGQFLGSFNLNQLPLNFPSFPWNGGQNDVIKVCFVSNGAATCCRTLEFPVPDCLGNDPCHIFDMVAVNTTCLCGQFFVAVTFQHQNGGNGGFDIVGNGNNYGNFPYNTTQPIILGPFVGDGTTSYEFGVVDHNHPDCHDAVEIGVIECASPVVEPGDGSSLVISPNPASAWLNVNATLHNGTDIGQATVKIYHADGRLLQTLVVGNANSFQLDINNLPAGVYRLSVLAAGGRLEGSFTKQ